MNSKAKALSVICTGTAALSLLVAVSAPYIGQEPAQTPHVRPVRTDTTHSKPLPQPEPPPALAGKETANTETNGTPPTGIAFEAQKPNATTEILTTNEPSRGNPTPEPSPPQTAGTVAIKEPERMSIR